MCTMFSEFVSLSLLCPLTYIFSSWQLERTLKNVSHMINNLLLKHFSVFSLHLGISHPAYRGLEGRQKHIQVCMDPPE